MRGKVAKRIRKHVTGWFEQMETPYSTSVKKIITRKIKKDFKKWVRDGKPQNMPV